MNNILKIQNTEGYHLIPFQDIYYLKGDGYCTIIYTKRKGDLEKIHSSRNLKTFEEELYHPDFYRVCKSYIVNLREIANFSIKKKFIVVNNGEIITIPKDKLCKLKLNLKNH